MNKYIENECPYCHAKPGEGCTWVGKPTEKYPQPEGSPSPMHASRKFYLLSSR